MRIAEFEKDLKANGFRLLRRGKHPQWSDGISRITLPSGGNSIDFRLSKELKLQLKKALKAKEKDVPVADSKPEPKRLFAHPPTIKQEQPPLVNKAAHEMWEGIKPLRDQKLNFSQIADRLSAMGWRTITGKIPHKSQISMYALKYGGPSYRTRNTKRSKRESAVRQQEAPRDTALPPQPKPVDLSSKEDFFIRIADLALSNLSANTKRFIIIDMINREFK